MQFLIYILIQILACAFKTLTVGLKTHFIQDMTKQTLRLSRE